MSVNEKKHLEGFCLLVGSAYTMSKQLLNVVNSVEEKKIPKQLFGHCLDNDFTK